MAVLQLFKPTFRVVKLAAAGQAGRPYQYTREARAVIVSAASAHPKDILAVLNSDISLGSGETLELLSTSQIEAVGTEGAVIYA
jgi:hypothetical protein